MPRRTCDGAGFLAAFRSAVANLERHVEEVNALNVFPVPDGDTGSNMLATVKAALEEADQVAPDASAADVAHAAARGALIGARGNSGVITSQILHGIAVGLAGKRRFNGLDLAHALASGSKNAYKAVPEAGRGHHPDGDPRLLGGRRRRGRARQRHGRRARGLGRGR